MTELLRDRRSLLIMFGIPLLLYPLLLLVLGSVVQDKAKKFAIQFAVVNVQGAEQAPKLISMLNDPKNQVKLVTGLSQGEADKLLAAGTLDAIIEVPAHYQQDALEAREVHLTLRVDTSRTSAIFMEKKIDALLEDYNQWIVQQRLRRRGLPGDLATPPTYKTQEAASAGQTFGRYIAQSLPVLLLLTGMLGAIYPAITATTSEREMGTLETLLVTPATRDELLFAKAGIVLICGLVTALLNMVSMALVAWRAYSSIQKGPQPPLDISIDPAALALAYLAAVPTLIFFTSLVLTGGLLARNLREANSYATPMMLIPVSAMLIAIADPPTSPGLLVTPVANTTVIIRDVLTGHASAGDFLLAFVSSCLYATLVLSLASRLFTNEQLVNPAWEPISLKLLHRRKRQGPRRFPAVDEAIALFAISLLLNFYVAPAFLPLKFLPMLTCVEVLLILGPVLLFAWLGRYNWREVFSLRPPRLSGLIAAILLGIGSIPVVAAINYAQMRWRILPPDPEHERMQDRLFDPALIAHPYLAPLVIGLLAGICEEMQFRGVLQTAFIRRFSPAFCFIVVGFLFAFAHLDIPGLPLRMALGIAFGWLVWRTGSIIPAMLAHATYDSVATAFAAQQLIHQGLNEASSAAPTAPAPQIVIVGIAMIVTAILIARPPPHRQNPP